MPTYKFYVRGHGGFEAQVLPPSENAPIDVVTVGDFGCTMEGTVADACIDQHWGRDQLQDLIARSALIYWTHAARDQYWRDRTLNFEAPDLTINPYETLSLNLVLVGANEIGGQSGLCYWDATQGRQLFVRELADGEELTLAEILAFLKQNFLEPDVTIELYWTACMSGGYWSGDRMAVSFNPTL